MIPRYSHDKLVRLWSDAHRLSVWLKVEIAVTEAWEERGLAPAGTAARLTERAATLDTAALAVRQSELEQTTQHDVIA
ncbi:MAG: adenylosuccinate lyase, partial [Deltaproteobacteria bacterium]|nr:adenylosuccinate lyase [Deltaproteobacteria bacterium]